MKQKILLASMIVLACISSSKAQINKGAVWLGGSVSVSRDNVENQNSEEVQNRLTASPAVGKVIKDNLVAGIGLHYYKEKRTSGSSNLQTVANSYGANVFVRRYFPIIPRIYAFAHGSLGGSYIRTKYTFDVPYERKGKGWSADLNVAPGVSFTLSKKVQLEVSSGNLLYARYSTGKDLEQGVQSRKTESFNAGFSAEALSQLIVGIRFLL
jgi:hypothetical protein